VCVAALGVSFIGGFGWGFGGTEEGGLGLGGVVGLWACLMSANRSRMSVMPGAALLMWDCLLLESVAKRKILVWPVFYRQAPKPNY
jgi:hypothetical protein